LGLWKFVPAMIRYGIFLIRFSGLVSEEQWDWKNRRRPCGSLIYMLSNHERNLKGLAGQTACLNIKIQGPNTDAFQ
jgi:hypothetical protein